MFIAIYAVLFSLATEAVLGVKLEQKDLIMTKGKGKTIHISCKVTELSRDYVHWYQKKDGEEALKRILIKTAAIKSAELQQINMFIAIYAVLFSSAIEAVLGVTLEQKDLSLTKGEGKTVFISCKVTGLSTDYVHWYQKKDGEALTRILYVKSGGSPVPDANFKEAKDFSVRIQADNYDLKIANLKKSHSAVYYCASWEKAVLGVTLEQKDLSLTKGEGKTVFISCKVTGLDSDNYVHWYQKKDGEALTRILYVKSGGSLIPDANFKEAKDFSLRIQADNYDLKIANLKKSHSAVYYCASWDSSHSDSKHSECVQKP
ncbi:hypothetical protein KOW79_006151 [Hemibagrus wyckioides]|uniref:Ig-like domain-containing protein n=1 Tax=Hemibagrus wyckioides TaxID=337641 RepID=A0A9D3SS87_9TELE|nr:hypothetical protein KOW79_006151 [Hemibagrus wyckioides]